MIRRVLGSRAPAVLPFRGPVRDPEPPPHQERQGISVRWLYGTSRDPRRDFKFGSVRPWPEPDFTGSRPSNSKVPDPIRRWLRPRPYECKFTEERLADKLGQ